jgi:hypothetical protein
MDVVPDGEITASANDIASFLKPQHASRLV